MNADNHDRLNATIYASWKRHKVVEYVTEQTNSVMTHTGYIGRRYIYIYTEREREREFSLLAQDLGHLLDRMASSDCLLS